MPAPCRPRPDTTPTNNFYFWQLNNSRSTSAAAQPAGHPEIFSFLAIKYVNPPRLPRDGGCRAGNLFPLLWILERFQAMLKLALSWPNSKSKFLLINSRPETTRAGKNPGFFVKYSVTESEFLRWIVIFLEFEDFWKSRPVTEKLCYATNSKPEVMAQLLRS